MRRRAVGDRLLLKVAEGDGMDVKLTQQEMSVVKLLICKMNNDEIGRYLALRKDQVEMTLMQVYFKMIPVEAQADDPYCKRQTTAA